MQSGCCRADAHPGQIFPDGHRLWPAGAVPGTAPSAERQLQQRRRCQRPRSFRIENVSSGLKIIRRRGPDTVGRPGDGSNMPFWSCCFCSSTGHVDSDGETVKKVHLTECINGHGLVGRDGSIGSLHRATTGLPVGAAQRSCPSPRMVPRTVWAGIPTSPPRPTPHTAPSWRCIPRDCTRKPPA